ncbi:hypothetical protein Tco_1408808 [Tanacetum coccineum]
MICRSWDVHTITGRYVSTNFIMSNAKANKEEYRIFRDHAYMIDLNGAASVRKTSVKGDVAGYVTNVGRITQQKNGTRTLDFSLSNDSGQAIRVTLWGGLNDALVERKTNKEEVSLSQATVHADYSQAKEGTLENLPIWARNRKMILRPSNAESRLMTSGHERDGTSHPVVVRNVRKELCGRMEVSGVRRVARLLNIQFRLELDVSDKTASTVVVMFDEPTTELLKCSTYSLAAADEDVGLTYTDDVGLPRPLANIIGTTQTLEIKSHTYYKHGRLESFMCWRIASEEVVEEDARLSNVNTTPNINIKQTKRLTTKPTVATPSKPTEGRGKKRVDLEDSDEEDTCGMDDGQTDSKDSPVLDKRKKNMYIADDSTSEIWYDEDVHDLRSVENEFPAIVFNDSLTSNETLSCEPTVSFLNDEIDFRISFDDFDDEDYIVVFDKNLFSYKIISTNDLKTDSEKVNMPLFPSPEPTVSCIDDLDFFKDFENEFPAIVYNDALTSKSDFSTKPTLCPQHIDEFDLKDETSFSEYDEEEQNIPDKRDLRDYWIGISSVEDFLGSAPSYTFIKDPMLRLCHRLIACSITRRSQAPKKVIVTDLFYLRRIDVGSANVLYLLARYLRLFASGRKCDSYFPPLPIIDMVELVRLQLCVELDDTWARVLTGPARQEGGAGGVAKEASVAPGGSDEDEEMPQAVFTTWTVTSLVRMMDKAGVPYTRYSESPVEYERRTRRMSDGASTSAAPQQPDP